MIFTIFNASLPFILGVAAGGFLVTVNFSLMCRSLKEALTPPYVTSMNTALFKHYLCFAISVVIISTLIVGHYVHPLGLVIGLSTIVGGFFLAALREVIRIL